MSFVEDAIFVDENEPSVRVCLELGNASAPIKIAVMATVSTSNLSAIGECLVNKPYVHPKVISMPLAMYSVLLT